MRRVGWLIEQIRSDGESRELRDEVIELGTRYGIVTPYTSFLATDGSEKRTARNESRNMNLRMPGAVTGQEAVTASKAAKAKQNTVTLSDERDDESVKRQKFVKKVNLKTFYLENNVWVDGEFREETKLPEVKLRFMSPEYFDLIRKEKDLAQYFSLGEDVIVVWKDKVYRVTK
jgi:Ca-activated chloride channel family protein